MTTLEQYEKICQRVLRKHYRLYRKTVSDSFFVDSEEKANAELTKTLYQVRQEVEASVYINKRDINSRQIAEITLGKYLNIGRKYGQRYYRRTLKIK